MIDNFEVQSIEGGVSGSGVPYVLLRALGINSREAHPGYGELTVHLNLEKRLDWHVGDRFTIKLERHGH